MSSTSLSSSALTSPRDLRSRSSIASLVRAFLSTDSYPAPAIARLVLGLVILPHGAQKLLGWYGGYGFSGTMNWFTETMHVPWILGFAAILTETIGGFALIVGLASRLAAAALGGVFATAIALVHAQHGFFANWFGQQKGEGIEYFVFGLALVAIVVIHGGGAMSADRAIARRIATPSSSRERIKNESNL